MGMQSDPAECCTRCGKYQRREESHGPCPDLQRVVNHDVIEQIYSCLYATELKHMANASKFTHTALESAPNHVQRRLQNALHWCHVGAGARICKRDISIAFNTGTWHPGGVAIADLQITSHSDVSFRFEVAHRGTKGGDLLFGLTKRKTALPDDVFLASLETGYEYILGRESAPASMFISSGSVRQCCFSRGDGTGPMIDNRLGSATVQISKLSLAGQWIEFHCRAGLITAIDFKGKPFQWNSSISEKEVWQPTFAWTGSTASIRIVRRD